MRGSGSSPPDRNRFADGYREAIDESVDHLVRHLTATDGRPSRGASPREAAGRVAATDLDRPLGATTAVLDELSRLWLDDTIWFHEPTYAAHLNCPVVIPALMAEVFVSGVNASLDTFDQSVGGTFIERHLIDWTAERIGYGEGADGIFTTGGTQSNLQALLLARAHRAWFHVDAAYGGGLLISPRHREWLAGVEQADSVTIDYHKTWFQPVSCSALVVRDGATLGHVTWHADYLNPTDSAHPNQVDKSLQTTRRFEALKLWVSLRTMGADVLGGYLDDVIDLTRDVAAAMATMGDIEIAAEPQLSTLVFRFRPAGVPGHEVDRINTRIRAELYDSGLAMVAATRVDGAAFLKFTLLNPKAITADILGIVELVRDAGARHLARRITGRDLHLRRLAGVVA